MIESGHLFRRPNNYKIELTGSGGQHILTGDGFTGEMGPIEIKGGGGSYVSTRIRIEVLSHGTKDEADRIAASPTELGSGTEGSAKIKITKKELDRKGKVKSTSTDTRTFPLGSRYTVTGANPNRGCVIWHDREHWKRGTVTY